MSKENLKDYVKREQVLIDKEFELISKLSEYRKEQGLSQRDLCNLIGIHQPALVKIEKGANSPQLNTILKILDVLGYTIEFKKIKKS